MRQPRTGPRKRKDIITLRKILTGEEERQFMVFLRKQAVSNDGKRLFLMCDILLNTGIRILELARLRIQDVPAVLGENVIEVYMGKGKKDRIVPVSKRLDEAIDKYIRDVRPKTLPRHVRRNDTSKPLFYSRSGKPYLQNIEVMNKRTGEINQRVRVSVSLYKQIGNAAKAAGIIKHVHPHMFRHTFAVNALTPKEEGGAGIDIYTLQNLMGHSDIITTSKYLHFVTSRLKGLGEKLDHSHETLF